MSEIRAHTGQAMAARRGGRKLKVVGRVRWLEEGTYKLYILLFVLFKTLKKGEVVRGVIR